MRVDTDRHPAQKPGRSASLREPSVEQHFEPWLRAIVWCTAALLCLILWAGVYIAAGGPLP